MDLLEIGNEARFVRDLASYEAVLNKARGYGGALHKEVWVQSDYESANVIDLVHFACDSIGDFPVGSLPLGAWERLGAQARSKVVDDHVALMRALYTDMSGTWDLLDPSMCTSLGRGTLVRLYDLAVALQGPPESLLVDDAAKVRAAILDAIATGPYCPGEDEAMRQEVRELLTRTTLTAQERARLEEALPDIEGGEPEEPPEGD
jgi:hypothetical protein